MRGAWWLAILFGVSYRIGCDCGGPSIPPSIPDAAVADAGGVDGGTDAGVDAGCPSPPEACLSPACAGQSCGNSLVCTTTSQCQCSRPVSEIAVGDGRSTVVLSSNLPRALLYTYRAQSQFQYTECTAGCDTATPTWTPPIVLIPDGGDIDGFRRPALAAVPTLTAAAGFPSSGLNLTYGECRGACSQRANWRTVILDPVAAPAPGTSATVAVAVAAWDGGLYRAVSTLTGSTNLVASPEYLECTGAGCDSPSDWSVLYVGPAVPTWGTDLVLWPEPTQLRRMTAFGSDSATSFLLYNECAGACSPDAGWLGPLALVDGGVLPSLAVNSDGVARISYYNLVTGAIHYTWCTQAAPPCTVGPWQDVSLGTADYVSALQVGEDGRARVAFTTSAGPQLATEADAGTGEFTIAPFQDCDGGLAGLRPSLALGSGDRYRSIFTVDGGFSYTQQSP